MTLTFRVRQLHRIASLAMDHLPHTSRALQRYFPAKGMHRRPSVQSVTCLLISAAGCSGVSFLWKRLMKAD